jgi:CheY-like chemotaxis protein
VITDLNMPNEGGVQLIEQVRADPRLSHLPIVVLTAHGTVDNLRASVVAGASGVLIKPPKKKVLAAELQKTERMLFNKQDPRLCYPNEFAELEDALVTRLGIGV